jgi:hypothetical protein
MGVWHNGDCLFARLLAVLPFLYRDPDIERPLTARTLVETFFGLGFADADWLAVDL